MFHSLHRRAKCYFLFLMKHGHHHSTKVYYYIHTYAQMAILREKSQAAMENFSWESIWLELEGNALILTKIRRESLYVANEGVSLRSRLQINDSRLAYRFLHLPSLLVPADFCYNVHLFEFVSLVNHKGVSIVRWPTRAIPKLKFLFMLPN